MDDEIKKLVSSYKPSMVTLEAMSHVKLLATVGPSASGKTTLMGALAAKDADFKEVIGETSRSPRPGEKEGVDFFFHSRGEIINDLKAGNLTQVVIGPSSDLYCTHVSNFPKAAIGLFPLIPQGVRQFRALKLKFFAAAFIVPDSFERWLGWLEEQAKLSSWTPAQKAGRLAEAKMSYEFALKDSEIRFVLNDDIDKAVERLARVGHGQLPDDEQKARETAQMNYTKLKGL